MFSFYHQLGSQAMLKRLASVLPDMLAVFSVNKRVQQVEKQMKELQGEVFRLRVALNDAMPEPWSGQSDKIIACIRRAN
jgi:hypothetical protein